MPHRRAETPDRSLSLLGLVSSGDLGDITCYRSARGRVVSFSKTWPKKPPTLAQLTGRARMSFGAEQWRGFQPVNKNNWRRAAKTLSLTMTGYCLWQQWYHSPNFIQIGILERQSRTPLYTSIDETEPHWPAKVNIQPAFPTPAPPQGVARFIRPFSITYPGTTIWLPFCVCHYAYAIGELMTTRLTLWGPGYYDDTDFLNRMWCWVKFETHDQPARSHLDLRAVFDDGSEAKTSSTIVTRFPPNE
jgi:hypothetical protein